MIFADPLITTCGSPIFCIRFAYVRPTPTLAVILQREILHSIKTNTIKENVRFLCILTAIPYNERPQLKKVAKTKGEANPCLRMLRDMKTQMSKTLTGNKPTMTQERECNNSEMLLRNWKYFDERCNFGLNHTQERWLPWQYQITRKDN